MKKILILFAVYVGVCPVSYAITTSRILLLQEVVTDLFRHVVFSNAITTNAVSFKLAVSCSNIDSLK